MIPNKKRIVLCGIGTVGKTFLRLLNERRASIEEKYGLPLELAAAVDIGGAAVSNQGALPLENLLAHLDEGRKVETFAAHGRPGMALPEVLSTISSNVLVETTPTNLINGEPARGHFLAALEKGMDVLAANKGPLVLCYDEILKAAKKRDRRVFMSAATAAALPTLDVGLLCLAGADILSIEGILNGTTNYILTRMQQDKISYESALQDARNMGIAETDPTADVEGLDTRNKLLILVNRIFDRTFGTGDISPIGITGITPSDIHKAAASGKILKLIGSAERRGAKMILSVAPKLLDAGHPLAAVNGSEKGICFVTDTMGRVTVTGGKSSPLGAAAALLKDLIHTVMLAP